MRRWRPFLLALAALLVATACGAILRTDERGWCAEHPREVLAASYQTGGPMTMDELLAESSANAPSPEYVRACRRAYEDG